MNFKHLLFALVSLYFAGCSTAYRAGQTPDDVYYSPAREAVAKTETKRDKLDDYIVTSEDQYLRMIVRNRDRWSRIDDYDYWYDSRYDHYANSHYPYYNTYGWNNWHYGYGRPVWNSYYYTGWHPGWGYNGYPVVINKSTPKPANVNRPRLGGYDNNRGYNNNNSFGDSFRKIVTPNSGSYSNSNSGSTYSNSTPSRTYNPPSSSSSSRSSGSSGSSSSGGSVSRPARGGN